MRGFPAGRTEALRTHFCNDEKHVAATVAGLSGCHMFASIFKATTFYDYLSSAMARVFHIPCHPVVHRCLPSNRPSLTQKPYISPVQPLHASRCTSPWPPSVSFHVALLPDRSMSQVQHLIEVSAPMICHRMVIPTLHQLCLLMRLTKPRLRPWCPLYKMLLPPSLAMLPRWLLCLPFPWGHSATQYSIWSPLHFSRPSVPSVLVPRLPNH